MTLNRIAEIMDRLPSNGKPKKSLDQLLVLEPTAPPVKVKPGTKLCKACGNLTRGGCVPTCKSCGASFNVKERVKGKKQSPKTISTAATTLDVGRILQLHSHIADLLAKIASYQLEISQLIVR